MSLQPKLHFFSFRTTLACTALLAAGLIWLAPEDATAAVTATITANPITVSPSGPYCKGQELTARISNVNASPQATTAGRQLVSADISLTFNWGTFSNSASRTATGSFDQGGVRTVSVTVTATGSATYVNPENDNDRKTYNIQQTSTSFSTAVDVVELVSLAAAAIPPCFELKHKFDKSEFNINATTSPLGHENALTYTFAPTKASISGINQPSSNETITLLTTLCGEETATSVPITVVDPSIVISSIGLAAKINETAFAPLLSTGTWKQYIEEVRAKIPGTPCPPSDRDHPETFIIGGSVETSKICCPTGVTDIAKWKGQFSGSMGFFQCDFPFYGVPYVATINVRITAGGSIGITVDSTTTCTSNNVCFTVSPSGYLGAGLSATVLGGLALDASLLGVASVSMNSWKSCIGTGSDIGQVCFNVKVEGAVTLLSFVEFAVSSTVIGDTCFHF